MIVAATLALAVVAWTGGAYDSLILASDEFGTADLEDARLTPSLVALARQLSWIPQGSSPQSLDGPSSRPRRRKSLPDRRWCCAQPP